VLKPTVRVRGRKGRQGGRQRIEPGVARAAGGAHPAQDRRALGERRRTRRAGGRVGGPEAQAAAPPTAARAGALAAAVWTLQWSRRTSWPGRQVGTRPSRTSSGKASAALAPARAPGAGRRPPGPAERGHPEGGVLAVGAWHRGDRPLPARRPARARRPAGVAAPLLHQDPVLDRFLLQRRAPGRPRRRGAFAGGHRPVVRVPPRRGIARLSVATLSRTPGGCSHQAPSSAKGASRAAAQRARTGAACSGARRRGRPGLGRGGRRSPAGRRRRDRLSAGGPLPTSRATARGDRPLSTARTTRSPRSLAKARRPPPAHLLCLGSPFRKPL
jgi:hypothetical protein